MMRLYVLGLTLLMGLSLLLSSCTGPADAKDPQRWWNAKVGGKDTAAVYVQMFDRNTGALTGKHKLGAGEQVRIIFDSSAKVGATVNLCRSSMVYFMMGSQLMSGTLDGATPVILMDNNVEFPPSDPYECKLYNYIGTPYVSDGAAPAPLTVSKVNTSTGERIAGSIITLPPGTNFWFSECHDHPEGAVITLDHHLIWVELGGTSGGRVPCIIEGPMPVTVSDKLTW